MSRPLRWFSLSFVAFLMTAMSLSAQQMQPTPNRQAGEGEGPFDRLVIRGVTVIDGTGAPPRGPMDIVVQQRSHHRGRQRRLPERADQRARPAGEGHEGNRRHRHVPDARLRRPARPLRRRPGERSGIRLQAVARARRHHRARRAVRHRWTGTCNQRELSAKNQIVAPRIFSYHRPFSGEGWDRSKPQTPETRARVGALRRQEGHRRPEARRATIRRSWRRCSTRRRSSASARPRTSIRWASCG